MKKNNLRAYIVIGIVFVVFSVISFAVPFSRERGFWIAYLSGVIAIAFQVYIYKLSFDKGEGARSKFYGFPIARIGVVYLALQMVLSLVTMIISKYVPSWIFVVAEALLIAAAAIGCITADAMRDEIGRQDESLRKNVASMRELQSLASSIAGQCEDEELKPVLWKLSDEFKYSDPMSCAATKAMEADMEVSIREIQQAMIDGDEASVKTLCAKLQATLAERNRVCRLNK